MSRPTRSLSPRPEAAAIVAAHTDGQRCDRCPPDGGDCPALGWAECIAAACNVRLDEL